MSFPIFKDFDKNAAEIFSEDYDSKYSLKVKSAGPEGTTITNTTTFDCKNSKLSPKISLKYPHKSGFTLEKLEVSSDCSTAVETSLTGAVEGLKLEFKGNDSDKGDFSFTYTSPHATITGEADFNKFSGGKVSVLGGHGSFTAGGCANIQLAKGAVSSTEFGLGLGYTVPNALFVGLRACKNFSKFSGLFSYVLNPNVTLAGKFHHDSKAITAALGSVYKCNPQTTIKVKADTAGIFSASVKQLFDKKFSVIGSAEVNPSNLNGVKFGVNATLG